MSWVQLNCNHFCSWCQTYDIEVQKLQPWSLKCKWSELLNTFVHLSIVCIYICIHILQFSLERSCISFTDVLFLLTGTAEHCRVFAQWVHAYHSKFMEYFCSLFRQHYFSSINYMLCLFQGKWIPGIHFPHFPMFGDYQENKSKENQFLPIPVNLNFPFPRRKVFSFW